MGRPLFLLAADLDGTLVREERFNPSAVGLLLRLLRSGRCRLVFATGRHPLALTHLLRPFDGLFSYLVCCDGACVLRGDWTALWARRLDEELASRILDLVLEHRGILWPQLHTPSGIYALEDDPFSRGYLASLGVLAPRLEGEGWRREGVCRLVVYSRDEGVLRSFARALRACPGGVEVTFAGSHFLDVLPRGVSKGAALRDILRLEGSFPHRLISLGDHMNDLEMADLSGVFLCAPDAPLPLRLRAQGRVGAVHRGWGPHWARSLLRAIRSP